MLVVISRKPTASGLTRIEVATGPVGTVTVSVPTATAHLLTELELFELVAVATATQRAPVRRRG